MAPLHNKSNGASFLVTVIRKVIATVGALALALAAAGQGVLTGTVSEQGSAAPLELVNVGVPGTAVGTVSDSRGRYRLEIHTADTVTVRYTFTGYEPQERRVCLVGGREMQLHVTLKAATKRLDEVEVTDEKTRQTTFTHIDVQHLENAVGPSSGVESLLKTLPDVNSNNELSSQYSVRGGSFDENLVYINGVEVFRPMLIRSGQQEGMSIINPDLVDYILFSPGGFDASYGDKMSSVLDITYSRPVDFKGKASISLLGGTASVQGRVGEKWSYAAAMRLHSNSYLLRTLDTKGSYTTRYGDLQAMVGYKVNDRLDLGLLAIWTRNVYGLVPESQTTAFSQRTMELDVYFDGAEEDKYRTLLGAVTMDWQPDDEWRLQGSLSAQDIAESERYDIQSQYWLYQVGMGEQVGETERFDRGVGTFLEHARNRLGTGIYALDMKATKQAPLGTWSMGVKLQYEDVVDRLREWRWVDSAGYAMPAAIPTPGDSNAMPASPLLQQYGNSNGGLRTLRGTAFLQREVNIETRNGAEIKMTAGVRGGLYNSSLEWYDRQQWTGLRPIVSPRLSMSYKPQWERDLMFRLATGIYQQAPFYREYRRTDGTLNPDLRPQTSYQVMGTADWNLRLWNRPFKITADLYYKYITDLVPYTVDNLRINYNPDQQAVAYATGFSLRINGELVDGLESWASISLMKTQEDIIGDNFGWLDRPTDQRLSIKVFVQDYIPTMPWWRMSLSAIYATGMPVTAPYGRQEVALRLPYYLRVDWGNTVQLARIEGLKHWKLFRYIDDIQVGIEIFNLFDKMNVISYLWVTDYDNHPYRVPNYLTARQVNVKLTILF